MIPFLLLATLFGSQRSTPVGQAPLRFHHLHIAAADPAHAMRLAAERLNAERTLLQGHGVGVRAEGQYLIFDRASHPFGPSMDHTAPDERGAAAAYRRAVDWLQEHDQIAEPSAFADTRVADAATSKVVVVAFSTLDVSRVVEALRAKALPPVETTDETARFRLRAGLIVEIVAETERPDTHWCPMHPDVRAPGAASCRLCGMALVPIPAPRVGEYRLDVTMQARSTRPGLSGLRFRVLEPQSGVPVRSFTEVHDRLFHLFIVSRDLRVFQHVHPVPRDDGSFELEHDLDGEYVLIADFLPAGGTPQLLQRAVVTPGYEGDLFGPPPDLDDGSRAVVVDGLRIVLQVESAKPFRRAELRFVVSDAVSGAATTDLEPYLGASGHLLAVSPDLTAAVHGHPDGPASSGPVVTFDPILPRPGFYKLWVQFQRRGRVVTAPFVIQAR